MRSRHQITPSNLRVLAHRAGFNGVAGLARAIGRSRQTVYAAVKQPQRHRPTLRLIQASLRK